MIDEMGIPENMVQVIRSLCANKEAKVLNLYSERICLHHKASKPRGTRHRSENGRKKIIVNTLRYADDTTLLAESKE